MASVTRIFAPKVVEQHGQEHAGVFTWEIDNDLFYADAAIARLFEIDPCEAENGLPLATYLDQIHPDDRTRAAKSVHDTILTGGPCQQDYKILQHDGPPIDVMAFGRCFKGRNGGVSHYAGIIHRAPAKLTPKQIVRAHCLAACTAAEFGSGAAVIGHLANALQELDRPDEIGLSANGQPLPSRQASYGEQNHPQKT